jgi:hypothetical protein
MILGLSCCHGGENTVSHFNLAFALRQGSVLIIYLGTGDEVNVGLEGYGERAAQP